MDKFSPEEYQPTVNAATEFSELANDFEHHYEAIREAIANAYDHKATEIKVSCGTVEWRDEEVPVFELRVEDDGTGMNREMLHAFFDIGNSIKPPGQRAIGYKGHGTKVYFHAKRIDVETTHESGERWHASLDKPWLRLLKRDPLNVHIEPTNKLDRKHGTKVSIYGYFDNKGHLFSHELLKDYILWKTAHGSAKPLFQPGGTLGSPVRLWLKGFDVQDPEEIKFGHPMPRDEVIKPRDVPEGEDPVDYKRLVYPPRSVHGYTTLNSLPYEVEIVGIVAGERARYQIPAGSDPARNRFGLWLARDYILIERKPDWIASDQAYIPFHFVVNCNQFALTANRGSVGNTPREVMEAVEKTVREYLSTEVYESKKYLDWEEARFEAQIRRKRSKQHEKIDKRTKTLQKRTLLHLPGSIEFTPRNEAETVLLLGSLIATNVNLIPVVIADAETQIGIDLLVRLYNSATRKLEYRAFEVEYKLSSFFAHKHGLDQVNGVVCWTDEGYSDGTAIEYEGKKVKYSVSQPNDGISTKGLAFDGTWIPIYVLADIVNFVRENPSAAKEWPRPFHCESCNKDLKMPLIDFVHHVNGH